VHCPRDGGREQRIRPTSRGGLDRHRAGVALPGLLRAAHFAVGRLARAGVAIASAAAVASTTAGQTSGATASRRRARCALDPLAEEGRIVSPLAAGKRGPCRAERHRSGQTTGTARSRRVAAVPRAQRRLGCVSVRAAATLDHPAAEAE
jgi:hypothetical protein